MDVAVIRVVGVVDNQTAVKQQIGVIDGLEGVIVHTFMGKVKEDLKGKVLI